MAQKEKNEQAAREYSDYKFETNAFVAGAEWALSHQWISVDEELPPYEENVFVKYEMLYSEQPFEVGYCIRWRTKDETIWRDKYDFSILGNMVITHWMPVPPLEGGEE